MVFAFVFTREGGAPGSFPAKVAAAMSAIAVCAKWGALAWEVRLGVVSVKGVAEVTVVPSPEPAVDTWPVEGRVIVFRLGDAGFTPATEGVRGWSVVVPAVELQWRCSTR